MDPFNGASQHGEDEQQHSASGHAAHDGAARRVPHARGRQAQRDSMRSGTVHMQVSTSQQQPSSGGPYERAGVSSGPALHPGTSLSPYQPASSSGGMTRQTSGPLPMSFMRQHASTSVGACKGAESLGRRIHPATRAREGLAMAARGNQPRPDTRVGGYLLGMGESRGAPAQTGFVNTWKITQKAAGTPSVVENLWAGQTTPPSSPLPSPRSFVPTPGGRKPPVSPLPAGSKVLRASGYAAPTLVTSTSRVLQALQSLPTRIRGSGHVQRTSYTPPPSPPQQPQQLLPQRIESQHEQQPEVLPQQSAHESQVEEQPHTHVWQQQQQQHHVEEAEEHPHTECWQQQQQPVDEAEEQPHTHLWQHQQHQPVEVWEEVQQALQWPAQSLPQAPAAQEPQDWQQPPLLPQPQEDELQGYQWQQAPLHEPCEREQQRQPLTQDPLPEEQQPFRWQQQQQLQQQQLPGLEDERGDEEQQPFEAPEHRLPASVQGEQQPHELSLPLPNNLQACQRSLPWHEHQQHMFLPGFEYEQQEEEAIPADPPPPDIITQQQGLEHHAVWAARPQQQANSSSDELLLAACGLESSPTVASHVPAPEQPHPDAAQSPAAEPLHPPVPAPSGPDSAGGAVAQHTGGAVQVSGSSTHVSVHRVDTQLQPTVQEHHRPAIPADMASVVAVEEAWPDVPHVAGEWPQLQDPDVPHAAGGWPQLQPDPALSSGGEGFVGVQASPWAIPREPSVGDASADHRHLDQDMLAVDHVLEAGVLPARGEEESLGSDGYLSAMEPDTEAMDKAVVEQQTVAGGLSNIPDQAQPNGANSEQQDAMGLQEHGSSMAPAGPAIPPPMTQTQGPPFDNMQHEGASPLGATPYRPPSQDLPSQATPYEWGTPLQELLSQPTLASDSQSQGPPSHDSPSPARQSQGPLSHDSPSPAQLANGLPSCGSLSPARPSQSPSLHGPPPAPQGRPEAEHNAPGPARAERKLDPRTGRAPPNRTKAAQAQGPVFSRGPQQQQQQRVLSRLAAEPLADQLPEAKRHWGSVVEGGGQGGGRSGGWHQAASENANDYDEAAGEQPAVLGGLSNLPDEEPQATPNGANSGPQEAVGVQEQGQTMVVPGSGILLPMTLPQGPPIDAGEAEGGEEERGEEKGYEEEGGEEARGEDAGGEGVAELVAAQHSNTGGGPAVIDVHMDDDDAELQKAIALSLMEEGDLAPSDAGQAAAAARDQEDRVGMEGIDEDMRLAIEASLKEVAGASIGGVDDPDLPSRSRLPQGPPSKGSPSPARPSQSPSLHGRPPATQDLPFLNTVPDSWPHRGPLSHSPPLGSSPRPGQPLKPSKLASPPAAVPRPPTADSASLHGATLQGMLPHCLHTQGEEPTVPATQQSPTHGLQPGAAVSSPTPSAPSPSQSLLLRGSSSARSPSHSSPPQASLARSTSRSPPLHGSPLAHLPSHGPPPHASPSGLSPCQIPLPHGSRSARSPSQSPPAHASPSTRSPTHSPPPGSPSARSPSHSPPHGSPSARSPSHSPPHGSPSARSPSPSPSPHGSPKSFSPSQRLASPLDIPAHQEQAPPTCIPTSAHVTASAAIKAEEGVVIAPAVRQQSSGHASVQARQARLEAQLLDAARAGEQQAVGQPIEVIDLTVSSEDEERATTSSGDGHVGAGDGHCMGDAQDSLGNPWDAEGLDGAVGARLHSEAGGQTPGGRQGVERIVLQAEHRQAPEQVNEGDGPRQHSLDPQRDLPDHRVGSWQPGPGPRRLPLPSWQRGHSAHAHSVSLDPHVLLDVLDRRLPVQLSHAQGLALRLLEQQRAQDAAARPVPRAPARLVPHATARPLPRAHKSAELPAAQHQMAGRPAGPGHRTRPQPAPATIQAPQADVLSPRPLQSAGAQLPSPSHMEGGPSLPAPQLAGALLLPQPARAEPPSPLQPAAAQLAHAPQITGVQRPPSHQLTDAQSPPLPQPMVAQPQPLPQTTAAQPTPPREPTVARPPSPPHPAKAKPPTPAKPGGAQSPPPAHPGDRLVSRRRWRPPTLVPKPAAPQAQPQPAAAQARPQPAAAQAQPQPAAAQARPQPAAAQALPQPAAAQARPQPAAAQAQPQPAAAQDLPQPVAAQPQLQPGHIHCGLAPSQHVPLGVQLKPRPLTTATNPTGLLSRARSPPPAPPAVRPTGDAGNTENAAGAATAATTAGIAAAAGASDWGLICPAAVVSAGNGKKRALATAGFRNVRQRGLKPSSELRARVEAALCLHRQEARQPEQQPSRPGFQLSPGAIRRAARSEQPAAVPIPAAAAVAAVERGQPPAAADQVTPAAVQQTVPTLLHALAEPDASPQPRSATNTDGRQKHKLRARTTPPGLQPASPIAADTAALVPAPPLRSHPSMPEQTSMAVNALQQQSLRQVENLQQQQQSPEPPQLSPLQQLPLARQRSQLSPTEQQRPKQQQEPPASTHKQRSGLQQQQQPQLAAAAPSQLAAPAEAHTAEALPADPGSRSAGHTINDATIAAASKMQRHTVKDAMIAAGRAAVRPDAEQPPVVLHQSANALRVPTAAQQGPQIAGPDPGAQAPPGLLGTPQALVARDGRETPGVRSSRPSMMQRLTSAVAKAVMLALNWEAPGGAEGGPAGMDEREPWAGVNVEWPEGSVEGAEGEDSEGVVQEADAPPLLHLAGAASPWMPLGPVDSLARASPLTGQSSGLGPDQRASRGHETDDGPSGPRACGGLPQLVFPGKRPRSLSPDDEGRLPPTLASLLGSDVVAGGPRKGRRLAFPGVAPTAALAASLAFGTEDEGKDSGPSTNSSLSIPQADPEIIAATKQAQRRSLRVFQKLGLEPIMPGVDDDDEQADPEVSSPVPRSSTPGGASTLSTGAATPGSGHNRATSGASVPALQAAAATRSPEGQDAELSLGQAGLLPVPASAGPQQARLSLVSAEPPVSHHEQERLQHMAAAGAAAGQQQAAGRPTATPPPTAQQQLQCWLQAGLAWAETSHPSLLPSLQNLAHSLPPRDVLQFICELPGAPPSLHRALALHQQPIINGPGAPPAGLAAQPSGPRNAASHQSQQREAPAHEQTAAAAAATFTAMQRTSAGGSAAGAQGWSTQPAKEQGPPPTTPQDMGGRTDAAAARTPAWPPGGVESSAAPDDASFSFLVPSAPAPAMVTPVTHAYTRVSGHGHSTPHLGGRASGGSTCPTPQGFRQVLDGQGASAASSIQPAAHLRAGQPSQPIVQAQGGNRDCFTLGKSIDMTGEDDMSFMLRPPLLSQQPPGAASPQATPSVLMHVAQAQHNVVSGIMRGRASGGVVVAAHAAATVSHGAQGPRQDQQVVLSDMARGHVGGGATVISSHAARASGGSGHTSNASISMTQGHPHSGTAVAAAALGCMVSATQAHAAPGGSSAAPRLTNSTFGGLDMLAAMQRALPHWRSGDLADLTDADRDTLLGVTVTYINGDRDLLEFSLQERMQQLHQEQPALHATLPYPPPGLAQPTYPAVQPHRSSGPAPQLLQAQQALQQQNASQPHPSVQRHTSPLRRADASVRPPQRPDTSRQLQPGAHPQQVLHTGTSPRSQAPPPPSPQQMAHAAAAAAERHASEDMEMEPSFQLMFQQYRVSEASDGAVQSTPTLPPGLEDEDDDLQPEVACRGDKRLSGGGMEAMAHKRANPVVRGALPAQHGSHRHEQHLEGDGQALERRPSQQHQQLQPLQASPRPQQQMPQQQQMPPSEHLVLQPQPRQQPQSPTTQQQQQPQSPRLQPPQQQQSPRLQQQPQPPRLQPQQPQSPRLHQQPQSQSPRLQQQPLPHSPTLQAQLQSQAPRLQPQPQSPRVQPQLQPQSPRLHPQQQQQQPQPPRLQEPQPRPKVVADAQRHSEQAQASNQSADGTGSSDRQPHLPQTNLPMSVLEQAADSSLPSIRPTSPAAKPNPHFTATIPNPRAHPDFPVHQPGPCITTVTAEPTAHAVPTLQPSALPASPAPLRIVASDGRLGTGMGVAGDGGGAAGRAFIPVVLAQSPNATAPVARPAAAVESALVPPPSAAAPAISPTSDALTTQQPASADLQVPTGVRQPPTAVHQPPIAAQQLPGTGTDLGPPPAAPAASTGQPLPAPAASGGIARVAALLAGPAAAEPAASVVAAAAVHTTAADPGIDLFDMLHNNAPRSQADGDMQTINPSHKQPEGGAKLVHVGQAGGTGGGNTECMEIQHAGQLPCSSPSTGIPASPAEAAQQPASSSAARPVVAAQQPSSPSFARPASRTTPSTGALATARPMRAFVPESGASLATITSTIRAAQCFSGASLGVVRGSVPSHGVMAASGASVGSISFGIPRQAAPQHGPFGRSTASLMPSSSVGSKRGAAQVQAALVLASGSNKGDAASKRARIEEQPGSLLRMTGVLPSVGGGLAVQPRTVLLPSANAAGRKQQGSAAAGSAGPGKALTPGMVGSGRGSGCSGGSGGRGSGGGTHSVVGQTCSRVGAGRAGITVPGRPGLFPQDVSPASLQQQAVAGAAGGRRLGAEGEFDFFSQVRDEDDASGDEVVQEATERARLLSSAAAQPGQAQGSLLSIFDGLRQGASGL